MSEFFLSSFRENPMIAPFKPEPYTSVENYSEQLPWISYYHETKEASNVYNKAAMQYKNEVIRYRYGGYDERESLRKALDFVIPHIGHSYVVPYFHKLSHLL